MDTPARDRDAEGHARNARPRDGLGRPLPYGAPGVSRQPEGIVRSTDESLDEAQRLLDEGKPFHAHEVFEDAWKATDGTDREVWRGLAQLAVGLTHAARGNDVGARSLLDRGAKTVEHYRSRAPRDLDVDAVVRWARTLDVRAVEENPSRSAPRLRACPSPGRTSS